MILIAIAMARLIESSRQRLEGDSSGGGSGGGSGGDTSGDDGGGESGSDIMGVLHLVAMI
jgi:hypothetical protein